MLRSSLVRMTQTIPASVSPAYVTATKDAVQYEDVQNKPTINGIVFQGNMSWEDLGIIDAVEADIDSLFN